MQLERYGMAKTENTNGNLNTSVPNMFKVITTANMEYRPYIHKQPLQT